MVMNSSVGFMEDPCIADPCPKCGKRIIKISYDQPEYTEVFTFQSYSPTRIIQKAGTYVLHHEPTYRVTGSVYTIVNNARSDMCFMDDPQFSYELLANKHTITRIRFKYKGEWTTNRRMHTW